MILIEKKLTRPDGGIIPSGSIIEFKALEKKGKIRATLTHWIDREKKFKPINCVSEFNYAIFIDSNNEEEVRKFIESKIGINYTKII